MRHLLLLCCVLAAPLAHAETTPQPPPPPADAALAPDDGERAEPPSDEPVEEADETGSLWGAVFGGAVPCLALDVVGGGLSLLGCVFSQIGPAGSGDNCLEDCVIGIISAGIAVFGVILGVAGFFVLGPVAAIAVTASASAASALAGRAFWGAALGGLPGIALGVGGVALAGLGLSQMDIGASGLEPKLFSGDPRSALVLAGFGMVAAAGVVSLIGAVVGDGVATALFVEEGEPEAARGARRGSELPLPRALASAGVAY